jgi:hypothetical protein
MAQQRQSEVLAHLVPGGHAGQSRLAMRVMGLRYLPLAVLSFFLLFTIEASIAHASSGAEKSTQPASYPEIVRLSFVTGDVRIARGEAAEKATGATWEKATADVPIESGFNLVTGDGRAEIEFEGNSTAYLAPNSVLMFDTLTATDSTPHTVLKLLSGRMTMHVATIFPSEDFMVYTPKDEIRLVYPQKGAVRLDSYLDGMVVTSVDPITLGGSAGSVKQLAAGQSFVLHGGHSGGVQPPAETADAKAWDEWVAQRYAERSALTSKAMHEAGLAHPVPGLAEMEGRGTFFSCAPYGTCWEPTKGWHPQAKPATAPQPVAGVQPLRRQGAHLQMTAFEMNAPGQQVVPPLAAQIDAQAGFDDYDDPLSFEDDDAFFPCDPFAVRYWYDTDPLTQRARLVDTEIIGGGSYEWAVCHSGWWISRGHHYVWVAGEKRHHRCPVRWVKNGGKTGFVPLHPKDVAGKPPINLKHGLYETKDWKNGSVTRIAYNPRKSLDVLGTPPKDFERQRFTALPRVEAPHAEARMLMASSTRPAGGPEHAPMNLTFDHRSQSFSLNYAVTQNGKTSMVSTPFAGSSRGMAGGTSSGFHGGEPGGFRGNAGGSGGNGFRGDAGRSGGSGYSGGGASHSGGGSASGGSSGASHSGGGGFSGGGGGGGGSHGGGGSSGGGGGGGSHK